jgi:hypothetical protein
VGSRADSRAGLAVCRSIAGAVVAVVVAVALAGSRGLSMGYMAALEVGLSYFVG